MDSIQYAEAIVREFLVYRGFAQTLRVFDSEVANDKSNGFQVDRIVELIFGVHIARFEAEKLVSMLSFLNERFFSRIDARYHPTVKKLDSSIKRYYIVHALQRGRSDKVLQFFESYGESLLLSGDDWQIWFALPYIKNAHLDPRFQLYFTKEWLDTLIVSFRNFLCQVFDGIRLPTMLKFNAERVKRQALAREVEELRRECARLRLLAENREKETHKLRRRLVAGQSQSPPARDGGIMMGGEEGRYSPELAAGVLRPRYSGLGGASAGSFPMGTAGLSSRESRGPPTYGSPPASSGVDRRASRLSYLDMAVLEGSGHLRKERSSPRSSRLTSRGQCSTNRLSTDGVVDCTATGSIDDDTECVRQSDYVASTSFSRNGISNPIAVNEPGGDFPRDPEGSLGEGIEVTGNQEEDSCVEGDDGRTSVLTAEGEFSRIDAQSQAAFSGHTSPITRCRLSVSGANVASASVDGTVRIWTYEVGVPTTRNATLYCGAEVLSLEWDSKSDRLLLMGTAEGGIKAWNVDAKRVVCDLSVDPSFPRVVDIKGSPTDAAFSCATSSASRNAPSSYGSAMSGSQVDSVDHPKGTVAIWNMRVWKILNTLVLGEEPSLVLSLCYNHNGKILATAATDGLIRLFDMSSCSLITSWTAHRSCAASCVRFGYNHTSVFTLGSDGNISEWSLHNQSQLLQSFDASKFCSAPLSGMPAHEMAVEPHGRSLLTTSCTSFAPIFSLEGSRSAELPKISRGHSGPITSVDWHPLLPVFITGSEDRAVRVTSL